MFQALDPRGSARRHPCAAHERGRGQGRQPRPAAAAPRKDSAPRAARDTRRVIWHVAASMGSKRAGQVGPLSLRRAGLPTPRRGYTDCVVMAPADSPHRSSSGGLRMDGRRQILPPQSGRAPEGMKYLAVCGGVVSGLGKGITISSIGAILKASGLRVTAIKIDPYLVRPWALPPRAGTSPRPPEHRCGHNVPVRARGSLRVGRWGRGAGWRVSAPSPASTVTHCPA